MKSWIACAAAFMAASLSSGCTTHLNAHVDDAGQELVTGIPYRLAERRVTVEGRWILDSCSINGREVEIGFKNEAGFTDELAEGERLAIDYMHMTNRFKTGQVDVSFWKVGEGASARQTGFIKSFNAEIKGEEAAALKSGIGAVASAAKLVLTAAGAVPLGGDRAKPQLVCDPLLFAKGKTPGAIVALANGEARLKAIAKEVEAATTRLALIKTRTIGTLSPADQAEFDKLNAKVDSLTAEKKKIEEAAVVFRQSYSILKKVVIGDFASSDPLPPLVEKDDTADVVKVIRPDDAKLVKLATKALICNPDAGLDSVTCAAALKAAENQIKGVIGSQAAQARAAILASIDLPGTGGARPSPLTAGRSLGGLVYREPVDARLWLSRPTVTALQTAETLTEKMVSLPQLGRVIVLPLRSRFAEKNGLSAEFEADGRPTKITYKAIEAGGPAMVESLKLALDEAGGLVTSVRTAREAKKKEEEGAELAALKDQIALLTEQQKLAELSKAPDPEAAARDAELQLLRYEKERAELRKAIAAANAP